MRSFRRALRSGGPLDLLAEVSSLLAVVDPREYGFGRRRAGEPPYTLRDLVDMFVDVDQDQDHSVARGRRRAHH